MHPALYYWRDDLPAHIVRLLSYVGALAILSIVMAQFFQSPPVKADITPIDRSDWIDIERPFPAFALAIPEAGDQPARYAIRRHAQGGGRKDILSLGEPDAPTPFLQVEIYRSGSEPATLADPAATIADSASALAPVSMTLEGEPLASKFGPLALVSFATSIGTDRQCLGFVRRYDDPRLQIAGWFCQSGGLVPKSTLACALDRLTLLAAGSEPKVGALFAQAELNRSFCGQREPLLAATPKYQVQWQALAMRSEPRRPGR